MQTLRDILSTQEQADQQGGSATVRLPKTIGYFHEREPHMTMTPQARSSKKNPTFFIRASPRVSTKRLTSPPINSARFNNSPMSGASPYNNSPTNGSPTAQMMDEIRPATSLGDTDFAPDRVKPTFRLTKPQTMIRVGAQSMKNLNNPYGLKPGKMLEPRETEEYEDILDEPIEEEKVMSLDEVPHQTTGDEVIESFYSHYRQLKKISDTNEFKKIKDQTFTSFLKKSEDMNLLPSKIGLVKTKGAEDKLKISHFRIGDKYAAVLAEGLKSATAYNKYELSHNRLTPVGANTILSSIPNRPQLINLTGNTIGKLGCEQLCILLMQRNNKLLEINLEANKLADSDIIDLCEAISDNDTVRKLNLSRNLLTNKAAEEIGLMLKNNSSLEEVYLRWNQIKGPGGVSILEGMKANPHIRVLDLSWNSLGLHNSPFAQAFADFIAKDKKLVHLDLSNNYFNKADTLLIASALERNHTLFGFHFIGNVGYVNAQGFLVIPDEFSQDAPQQTVKAPIDGCQIKAEALKRYQNNNEFKDSCWICEGWRPIEIKWEPEAYGKGDKEPVYVFFSHEGYKNRYLPKKKGFKLARMVPPVATSCIFSADDKVVCAKNLPSQQYTGVSFKLTIDDSKRPIKPDFLNVIQKVQPQMVINEDFKPVDEILHYGLKPRMPEELYIPPEIKIIRNPWKFATSAFKEYKQDTQPLLDKCFEVDFEGTRISKIIKNQNELYRVREMLHSIYRPLKDCYKHYAAIGAPSEIWSILLNTYTDFAVAAGLIDGKIMKLSDFDRVFIATYTKTDKERNPRNPDRALVRYQFLEGVVRLADQKFMSNGTVNTYPEAVKLILDDHIGPYVSKFDHQKWRDERYWNEDVDAVMKSYMPLFKGAYKKFSGLRTLPGQKKFMCMEEFYRLVNEMGILNDNCGERDATLFFGLSFMTQVDELNSDRIYQMQFVEFLEAFARIADKFSAAPCGKTEAEIPYDQRAEQPLSIKLEGLMQRLLNVCNADTKDVWVLPETTIFEMPEVKGRVWYATKKKKIVRIDPTEPGGAEAYGV